MTRGTIYFVTDKYIIETLEFNGDMYPSGHGNDVIGRLENVDSIKTFKKEIIEFNKSAHNYDEGLFHPTKRSQYLSSKNIVDMKDYFNDFFSDWTFWKNCSSKDITFVTRENEKIILKPNEQVAINFGHKDGNYSSPQLEEQDA